MARGDDAAVAANRAQLEQLRAWQKDSAPLEKLRQELLAQLENAEDPIRTKDALGFPPPPGADLQRVRYIDLGRGEGGEGGPC